MKKIYILTAVMALLTMSLNAQTTVTRKAEDKQKSFTEKTVKEEASTEKMEASTEKIVTPPSGSRKAPNRANRSTTGTLLVADATTTNTSIPVYGLYQDYGYRTQMIYTEAMLKVQDGLEEGDKITSLTFYPSAGMSFAASTITFKLCHTNTANFGTSSNSNVSRISVGSDAVSATVSPTANSSATTWTITFNSPLTYNGGNLLLDVYCVGYNHDNTTGGACPNTSFYAARQTNYQSLYVRGTTGETPAETKTGTNVQYLPKTTFTFERPDPGTICDGTEQNEYLPIFGFWYDNKQINQMIYPKELLTDLKGKRITSMTFYSPHLYFSGGKYSVKLGTTNQSNFSSIARNTNDLSVNVATDLSATAGGTEMTITFEEPFKYEDGNLLIDFEVTEAGSYGSNHTYFYGVTHTGGGFFSRGSSTNSSGVYTSGSGIQDFLPKVTFTYDESQHDLAIALSAPSQSSAGNPVTVTATVTNNGSFDETSYTVTISANGTTISTQTVTNETLAAGASRTFTVQYPTNTNAGGQTVNFTATVTCTDDADATNNSATASTSLINLPPPENVVATVTGAQSATVTWNPPTIPNGYVTEDFEDTSIFRPFSTGGITATQHTGAFGDWTLYDATGGSTVYASTEINFTNEGAPHAWFVFKPSDATPDANYPNATPHDSHSGAQYLESICPTTGSSAQGVSDHWLISPELSGYAQTITWWDSELTTIWGPETYEVLISTTDNTAPGSFTKLTDYTINYDTWGEQSLQLPAGTKYFAFRHISNDIFGVLVDDITYEPAGADPQPVSYNVYLDGVLVGNVDSDDPLTFTFNNVSGEHECAVSAVYPNGMESVRVPATFTTLPTPEAPTVTPVTGATDVTITITPDPATDGTLVYSYVDQNGNEIQGATNPMSFPRGETEYVVTVHAQTTATGNYNASPEAVVPVTISALPATAAPSIEITSTTDSEVTITATGNGTVTLTINGQTVSGSGSVSITVPRGMEDYTVTATATAKEENHPAGTTTQDVLIPGRSGQGWIPMDGDYLNGSDQLSFIDARTHEPILFVDQYAGDTEFNMHPASYKYTLEEVVTDNPKKSGEVPIYIPKIDSKLTGVYTQDEVDNDDYGTASAMTPNVLNGTMSYKIAANDSVAFYGLYRGDAVLAYPELNDSHMISKLRQFGEQGSWYFDEMVSGKSVSPVYQDFVDYDEVDVVRWDQDYLQDSPNGTGTGTYVPVIWISAMSTGRKDMIDNSYGSDIKEVVLGDVEPTIYLVSSGNSAWGKWKYQGQDYMVYNPQLDIEGLAPADAEEGAKDGDQYIYTPYMYRAWLKYSGARYYTRNADGHLEDAGEMPSLIPLGTVMITSETEDPYHVELGERWDENNPTAQIPNSFGAPANLRIDDLEFIVRFYYKKTVAEAPTGSKLAANRDGDAKGEYYIVEKKKSQGQIITAVDEFFGDRIVVDVTYVNALGQQSSKPFDGVNIIVTRYSDGTTTTTKVVR